MNVGILLFIISNIPIQYKKRYKRKEIFFFFSLLHKNFINKKNKLLTK